ncbi:MAG: hypothetical protein AMXMBFR67_28820 [Nitrospira sp.]
MRDFIVMPPSVSIRLSAEYSTAGSENGAAWTGRDTRANETSIAAERNERTSIMDVPPGGPMDPAGLEASEVSQTSQ